MATNGQAHRAVGQNCFQIEGNLYNNWISLNYSAYNFIQLITLHAVSNRHFLSKNTKIFPTENFAVILKSGI